jgi:hypothetical protein
MKIVIGHKNLNLEELFQVACKPSISEVVIDSVTSVDFAPPTAHKDPQVPPPVPTKLSGEHIRAVLLVKLL